MINPDKAFTNNMWYVKCHKCNKEFKIGEKVIQIGGNGRWIKRYHKQCFTDGRGKPIYE